ncbi:PKD domain-containing protein [Aeromicrobium halocynthiae]
MPRLTLRVQPGGRTLVNVPTILSTTPADVDRTITLLGSSIDVRARPTSYTWHHGDGTTQTTTGPGAPWPAKDVTHTYRRSAQVSLRLDVAYTVRYRVDGSAWTPLDQPLTTTSAAVALRVDQAAPVLTRP